MKKFFSIILLLTIISAFASCGKSVEMPAKEPDINQIRSICNLATLECYYHNVAKSEKKAGTGFTHIGEKDRQFWIEYTGIAKIGIDMSEVQISLNDTNVKIFVPEAKLLSITISDKDLNENSYISSDDNVNKNPITANDQSKAIAKAQKGMEQSVIENKTLMLSAQTRAKDLIESYVLKLGSLSDITYNIEWVDSVDDLDPVIENTTIS